MNNTPKITVITSVYNCEKYIAETIKSVINQTFNDWEYIIINDNSKDSSASIIRSFKDERIIFIDNTENRGQCKNLNMAIEMARGDYIARLDHDDICYPNRFEKQYEYMQIHPEIDLLGSHMDILEDELYREIPDERIYGSAAMRFSHSFFNYSMPHSSFFLRRKTLIDNNIRYDEKYLYCEDYKLTLDILAVGEIDYIHETLIAYRMFPEQLSQVYSNDFMQAEIDRCRREYLDINCIENKKIIKKAIIREIHSLSEYMVLQNELKHYAIQCSMDFKDKNDAYAYARVVRSFWGVQPETIWKKVYHLLNVLKWKIYMNGG